MALFLHVRIFKISGRELREQSGGWVAKWNCFPLQTMNTALDAPVKDARGTSVPPAKHATYLDDITTGDADLEECWRQSEIVIAWLALRNLPIGIWKCDFLTT